MTDQIAGISLEEKNVDPLNNRQQAVYAANLAKFKQYLETKGKNPKKEEGYAEDSIPADISRFHRTMEWVWNNVEKTTKMVPEHADQVVEALEADDLRRRDGEAYAGGSKRKITETLISWFNYEGVDWEPEIEFSDGIPKDKPDPFTKPELRQLWQTALEYKSIPSYNNVTPVERAQWKATIAQELGKPKEQVTPDDWEKIVNWHIPSLIRTARGNGWRPAMVGRLKVDWYEPDAQKIVIPEGKAVKNGAGWTQELADESAFALNKWLEQRATMEKYSGRSEIWLNRKGNPYESGTLNDLLNDLMDEAGINQNGRKLVWTSFRHSIGTYVYEEYKDLGIVAERLRQLSTESAAYYVHPTKELRKEAAEVM